jgi:hypothetical protein
MPRKQWYRTKRPYSEPPRSEPSRFAIGNEERMFQGSAPATERLIHQLGDQSRRYIDQRLGSHPRDFPGPGR